MAKNIAISALKADITTLTVDAIVNAANNTLLGGGGIDGAIHRAAGPQLRDACRALGGCETGNAKLTAGFDLPAQYVIHTVGPVWQGGKHHEADLLAKCYLSALDLAVQHNIQSIAFPAISTGVFGYPLEAAAKIAVDTTYQFLQHTDPAPKVIFCCFDDAMLHHYQEQIRAKV